MARNHDFAKENDKETETLSKPIFGDLWLGGHFWGPLVVSAAMSPGGLCSRLRCWLRPPLGDGFLTVGKNRFAKFLHFFRFGLQVARIHQFAKENCKENDTSQKLIS